MSAAVQQAVPKLCASEVWALYGGELEYCLGGDEGEEQEAEDFDRQSESSGGQASASEPCSPSAPGYELVRENAQAQACLSTQDYYDQLEALKRMHLQDMADLEVRYVNEPTTSKDKASQVSDRDEIDSAQEESEALPGRQETSTISQQDLKPQQKLVSESDTPESWGMELEKERKEEEEEEDEEEEEEEEEEAAERESSQGSTDGDEAQSLKPLAQPEPSAITKAAGAGSKQQSRASSRRSSGVERSTRGASRLVTVPKPFKMMLREEDKKRRNVKTRSEVELENTLLRRELEELRQCRRQFRATPAPPTTRLPLGKVVSGGGGQHSACRRSRPSSLDRASDSSAGSTRRRHRSSSSSSRNTSPQPFSFLERERKKKEQKLEEVLRSGLSSREDRWVFKARPLPRMYRATADDYQLYGAVEMHSRGEEPQQQQTQHCGPPASRELHKHAGRMVERERRCIEMELDMEASEEKPEDRDVRPMLDSSNWRLQRKPSLGGKGLLVEGETGGLRRARERDWSYIHPIQRTCISLNLASSLPVNHERLLAGKSDYISV